MSFEAMSWAVQQKLPALQKIVLLMLADRTNKDTSRCDPSITRLAEDCGMSERSTRNAIRALENIGLIETIHRSREGVNLPNHYRLKIQSLVGVGHHMPQGTARPAPGVGHHVPTNQEVKPVIEPEYDAEDEKPSSAQSSAIGIKTFLDYCKAHAEKPIPESDPVFEYASRVGIPNDFLWLCWREFVDRNHERGKRYRNWRQAFRNCVRENWYKLWWCKSDGDYELTTSGVQAQRKPSNTEAAAA